jgi:hypothetical protein
MPKSGDFIPVKYSEDTAQFADLRPVRRQPMTLHELVGLVLISTGKHRERLRERLAKGTCAYNIYRYWWEGFAVDPPTLETVLAAFPDPDPARPFDPALCLWARFFDDQQPTPHETLIEKEEAGRRRWFRRRSFWDSLMEFSQNRQPIYQDYSYYHRADLYRVALAAGNLAQVLDECRRLAHRSVQHRLWRGSLWVGIELGCRR